MSPIDSSADSSKCHLLSLSGELRNRIYRYTVLSDKPIQVLRPKPFAREEHPTEFEPPPQEPALASTCKQIRQQVIPIFWAENTFDLAHTHLGGALAQPFAGVILEGGFHGKEASDKIQTWADILGPRTKYLHAVMASTESNNASVAASASLDEKGSLTLAITEKQRYGRARPQECCSCRLTQARDVSQDRKLDGWDLLDMMRNFCENYFDHRQYNSTCGRCSLPKTRSGMYARRGRG